MFWIIMQIGLLFAFLTWVCEKLTAVKNKIPAVKLPSKPHKAKYVTRYPVYSAEKNVDFLLSEPHFLIGGTTGSGKSNLLQFFLLSLTGSPKTERLILIDCKKVEFYPWRNAAGIEFIDTAKDAAAVLDGICAEIDLEYTRMQKVGLRESDKKYTYIVIDELADLMLNRDVNKQLEKSIQRIAQIGRAAHYKLICCTQAIRASVLPLLITNNLTGRICLRTRDAIESRLILGCKGAETLPQVGKCYTYTSRGGLSLETIPYIPDSIIQEQIKSLV